MLLALRLPSFAPTFTLSYNVGRGRLVPCKSARERSKLVRRKNGEIERENGCLITVFSCVCDSPHVWTIFPALLRGLSPHVTAVVHCVVQARHRSRGRDGEVRGMSFGRYLIARVGESTRGQDFGLVCRVPSSPSSNCRAVDMRAQALSTTQ